jgi:predicted transcriptional regulator of viral defense system
MKYDELVALVGERQPFETGLLLSGDVDPTDVRRQLSRWVRADRVIQLRRGLYMLAAPYQRASLHPFLIANALIPGSYVSLQSALAYYGLIPEHVPLTLSVTTRRPAEWRTPFGDFPFHHLAPHLFFGYQQVDLPENQQAFIAFPEKALLDLIHFTPNGADPVFLSELRLQNLENLDRDRLQDLAKRAGKPKWQDGAKRIAALIVEEKAAFETS